MRFTTWEMFAATFFIALVAGATLCVDKLSKFSPLLAILFFGSVMAISIIGLLASSNWRRPNAKKGMKTETTIRHMPKNNWHTRNFFAVRGLRQIY